MGLSYDEIGEIIKLIDKSSCDEFVLETGDIRLVVRRNGASGPAASFEPAAPAPSIPVKPSQPAPPAAKSPAAMAPAARNDAHGPMHVVASPMVGTFYRSPSPGTPTFVNIGSPVKKGDPICIIEVMKLFTTIHADWNGTIVEIGADNAQLVEYGQMLFVIKPE